ncbi:MAG: hypothetical protein M3463_19880, partial [Verrucomicrobiota bacterium]|nr:hypothetical protein [Verrucomicrobiota bacterium]
MSAAAELEACCWPLSRLGEALGLVARIKGLGSRTAPEFAAPHDSDKFSQWLDGAATSFGLEAEPVEAWYSDIDGLIHGAAPALLRLPREREADFLVLTKSSKRRVSLLGTDHVVRAVSPEMIR